MTVSRLGALFSSRFWPPHWHTRVASMYAGFMMLMLLPGGINAGDLTWAVASVALFYLAAAALDLSYPTSWWGAGLLRSVTVYIVIVIIRAIVSLVADDSLPAHLFCWIVVAAVAAARLRRFEATDVAAVIAPARSDVESQRPLAMTGPVSWPSSPPADFPQTAMQPLQPFQIPWPTPRGPSAEPASDGKRPFFHRLSSVLVVLLWVPLGALFAFALNWCPDDGAATATAYVTYAYLGIQFFGNPIGAWMLDRRFRRAGGAVLAFGRSILVALALAVAGLSLLLLIPNGPGNYCG